MVSVKERLERVIEEMVGNGVRLPEAVRDFEKKYIAAAVEHAGGCQSDAAKLLGVHRNTIAKKMNDRPPASVPSKRRKRK